MAPPTLVTLTKYSDLFDQLHKSICVHDPEIQKIVVTSGGAQVHIPGWRVVPGVEPFVFARNANLGLKAAGSDTDVLLINDDCQLLMPTLGGLAVVAAAHPPGLLSPQIRGGVGNPQQREQPGRDWYEARDYLCFVAIYLPAAVRSTVGPLDEQFIGYGGDDRDYSYRARKAGFTLGITADVVVHHGADGLPWSASFHREMTWQQQQASMCEMDRLVHEKHTC
jgi:hypothetical protein